MERDALNVSVGKQVNNVSPMKATATVNKPGKYQGLSILYHLPNHESINFIQLFHLKQFRMPRLSKSIFNLPSISY